MKNVLCASESATVNLGSQILKCLNHNSVVIAYMGAITMPFHSLVFWVFLMLLLTEFPDLQCSL